MRKVALLLALLYYAAVSYGQEDSIKGKNLEEAIVYANKFAEKKKNLAQKIDVISTKTIAQYNAQNTGDLLINTGNVFVQKSQQGGSSPVLRGFEASRVLLVIDGIRMNNAIYRAGHLQNIITVDQNMLESVEVMYGPASTIYGSDALGGIIHLRSKSPKLSTTDNFLVTGSVFGRYSSANNEKTGHFDLSIGEKKFGWLQSYTFSDFEDMKMGSFYPDKYPGFGKRSQYIDYINGADVIITNKDDRVQRFSGYSQWDVTQKFLFKPNEKIIHTLNLQYSSSTDVPRYDRLQDIKNGTLRYAKWYYGPQKRLLAAYEPAIMKIGFFDELKANINYQDIEESRQTREYLRYDRFDSRVEKVKVAGFTLDGRKVFGNNELNMGIDGQLNNVKSRATRTNINTATITKLDTRYPDGINKVNYFGVYAQHLLKMQNGKLVLNDGIRLQAVSLHSTIIDNSFFNFPFTDIKQHPFAATGNLGLVYMPFSDLRLTGNLSSGFRAPNLDDLTKIFESSTAIQRLVVSNPNIKPEYTYNLDIGIAGTIKNKIRTEATAFYTLFRSAITTGPFRLNGQDSIMYNGVKSAVYANQNINKAYSLGFNARLKIDFVKNFSLDNTVTYTYGRFKNTNGIKKPLDHIPPVFGKSSLIYSYKNFGTEIYAMYNGWKRIKDYNPDGEDNQQYATADGMPSWFTLNWRANYMFNKKLTLQAGIENIFDHNYRYFASGFSAPGRNFIVAIRTAW